MENFCHRYAIDMSPDGQCSDILNFATHQRDMIREEKIVGILQRSPQPHFGVCIATYQRPYDLEFALLLNTSLPSVLRQSFPHWTIILVGDALSKEQEALMLRQINRLNISPEKIVYRNLPAHLSEKNIYKERPMLPCAVPGGAAWCHSGTNAMNFALDIADTIPEISHVLLLGDDDTFYDNHLANLARAFKLSGDGEIKFAYTRGYSTSTGWMGYPIISNNISMTTFSAPSPCKLFIIAAGWSKSLKLRQRLDVEQSLDKRGMKQCCDQNCVDGIVLPNDADLLERVNTMVYKKNLFSSVFIPQTDVIHLSSEDRLVLVDQIIRDKIKYH